MPIYLRIASRMRAPSGTAIGQMRRVIISNIVVYNADPRQASIVSGVPGGNIEDISLHDIRIYTKGGGTAEQAARKMPEVEKEYPEPERHGITSAYGFYIRHVNDIDMHDIKVVPMTDDQRPVFVADSVSGIELRNISIVRTAKAPLFFLKDVTNFSLSQSAGLDDVNIKATVLKEF